MNKKRILCYGDSNIWGWIPGTEAERFSEEIRFPQVLQRLLGMDFEIIEEGLASRTLVSEYQRPGKEGRNGSTSLMPCLILHDPLDLVILLLGTNELKKEFNNTAEQIGEFLENYYAKVIPQTKSKIRDSYPKLLIIAPAVVDEQLASPRYGTGSTEKNRQLGKIYSEVAERNNCNFLDASELAVGIDGVHLTPESHGKLAEMLYQKIKSMNL
jgi:lysophospholipase L1-like esterase